MKDTGIEWADSTWSPWRGCTKVSAGYAETLSKRNPDVFGEWGKGKPRVINKNWNEPVKWNKHGVCVNCGFVQSRTGTKPHQTKGGSGVCGQPKDGRIVQTFRRLRVFPSLCNWPELWRIVGTMNAHRIQCDDREGEVVVIPDKMGDIHLSLEPCEGMTGARPSFRARTYGGGGRNERVRIALALLALAIEEDSKRIEMEVEL